MDNGSDAQLLSACEMFERRLSSDPDAVFIVTPDGVERSYADVARVAEALSGVLRGHAVGHGDIVGLYLWNDPAWVVAMFATWWLGAAIAACGALAPPSEAARRFGVVSPRVIVVADDLEAPSGWDTVRVSAEGKSVASATAPGAVAKANSALDDVAAIFFTSGTTGEAKPIVHYHRRIAEGPRNTAGAYSRSAEFRPRVAPANKAPAVSFSPFGHVAGMGRMVFRMFVGRPLLLVPKFDVAVLQSLAARYPLDTLQLTPAMVYSLAFTDAEIDLGSLKYVNSGTAPLPAATREVFERRYRVPVLQAYGSTEGGVTALESYEDALAGRRGPGSVGRVPPGTSIRIVDATGADAAHGEEGEILGRPEHAANRHYLTSIGEAPLPVDSGGWYHTGDVGRLDAEGILYVTGRLKDMMIVGGFNVYPGEVEDALRRSDLVRDAVVVAVPDDRLGEVPVAGIVWETPTQETILEDRVTRLAHQVRDHLEAYKLPRRWTTLEALPLTPNGKLDRRRAAEMLRG